MLTFSRKAKYEGSTLRGVRDRGPQKKWIISSMGIFCSDPSLFDLIITDQAMPGIPGDQLATEVLKIRKDMPVILCTGHSETISSERARKIGIVEFLMKPLKRQEFAAAIRRVLDRGTGT